MWLKVLNLLCISIALKTKGFLLIVPHASFCFHHAWTLYNRSYCLCQCSFRYRYLYSQSNLSAPRAEVCGSAGARLASPLSRGQVHQAIISWLKPRVGEDGDVCGAPMRFGKLLGSIAPAHETCTYLDVPKFAETKRFKDALHELAALGR